MLHMEPRHLEIVKDILSQHPYQFFVFGSRVSGKHRELSDLDLCYKESISDIEIAKIEEAFEQSDLPFEVDIVAYDRCDHNFKKIIDKQLIVFP